MPLQFFLFCALAAIAAAQSFFPCHPSKSSRQNDVTCTRVEMPPQLCQRCPLRPTAPDGRFEICTRIYDTESPECHAALQQYVDLNAHCDPVRSDALSKMLQGDDDARMIIDYFLYSLCEQCCDCIPMGTEKADYQSLSQSHTASAPTLWAESRGNCPAHAHFDVCKNFPHVTYFARPGDPVSEALPKGCKMLKEWLNSPESSQWETNPNTIIVPQLSAFLRSLLNAIDCEQAAIWGKCYDMEKKQSHLALPDDQAEPDDNTTTEPPTTTVIDDTTSSATTTIIITTSTTTTTTAPATSSTTHETGTSSTTTTIPTTLTTATEATTGATSNASTISITTPVASTATIKTPTTSTTGMTTVTMHSSTTTAGSATTTSSADVRTTTIARSTTLSSDPIITDPTSTSPSTTTTGSPASTSAEFTLTTSTHPTTTELTTSATAITTTTTTADFINTPTTKSRITTTTTAVTTTSTNSTNPTTTEPSTILTGTVATMTTTGSTTTISESTTAAPIESTSSPSTVTTTTTNNGPLATPSESPGASQNQTSGEDTGTNNEDDPSSPAETSPDDVESGTTCFPSSAIVELSSGVQVPMSQLRIGDSVRVSRDTFSDVFLFSHRTDTVSAPSYVELVAEGLNMTVRLTAGHLLRVNEGAFAAAGRVKKGDRIESAEFGWASVLEVREVRDRGLFNPHTLDGNIVVNGIIVSTYTTAIPRGFASVLLEPLRILYKLGIVGEKGFGKFLKHGFRNVVQRMESSEL